MHREEQWLYHLPWTWLQEMNNAQEWSEMSVQRFTRLLYSFACPPPLCICSSKICFFYEKKTSEEFGAWGSDGFWGPLSIPTFTSLSVVSYLCGWLHNWCTAGPKEGWLQISNTPDPGASAPPFPKSCANLGGYLANILLGRGNLFLTCQPFSWSLGTFCVPKGR